MMAGAPGAFCAGADIGEFLESAQSGGLRPKTVEFLHALARNPKAAGRRGRRPCGRHRHDHAAALRLRRCRHQRDVRDAVLAARPHPRSRIEPAGAHAHGPCARLRALAMGRPLSAAAAKEAGIVNEVVDPAAVDEVALKAAHDIAACRPAPSRYRGGCCAASLTMWSSGSIPKPCCSASGCNPTRRALRSPPFSSRRK